MPKLTALHEKEMRRHLGRSWQANIFLGRLNALLQEDDPDIATWKRRERAEWKELFEFSRTLRKVSCFLGQERADISMVPHAKPAHMALWHLLRASPDCISGGSAFTEESIDRLGHEATAMADSIDQAFAYQFSIYAPERRPPKHERKMFGRSAVMAFYRSFQRMPKVTEGSDDWEVFRLAFQAYGSHVSDFSRVYKPIVAEVRRQIKRKVMD